MKKRIVVTGLGVITPIGIGKEEFWEAALAGRTGISLLTSFDTSAFDIHIAAEVKDFKADEYLDAECMSGFGRQAQFVVAASRMAFDDAGIDWHDLDPYRVGVVVGTLFAEPVLFENAVVTMAKNGLAAVDHDCLYRYPYSSLSYAVSSVFDFYGPSETIFCACSSGNMAIARACDLIESGRTDMVVAGGVDIINVGIFSTFHGLKSLSPTSCKPFDKNRDGIVFGEGSGILLVQSLESAQRMGSRVYGEILGFGLSCDAHHPSAPDPEGKGLYSAMRTAFADAGLNPEKVDYVSAHGTGTKINDRVETAALKRAFGAHSRDIKISSIKSMIGHSMGASSAIEAVTCCLVLDSGMIPPTINYTEPDPECDLNYVPNNSMQYPAAVCLNNSLAFGGINASLILGKL